MNARRIVLLGKTGAGKSSLANSIFGEDVFKISHCSTSEKSLSRAETKYVNGKSLMLIDTCSFLDTCGSEVLLNTELLRCITECAPGPHAFLIVLKVEKFTEHEQDVIRQICRHFSEDALKHAAVVFTHGDQLPEGTEIQEFVSQNKALGDVVGKCGGRCHVVDNKYWRNNGDDDYRSNEFHVGKILSTIDEIIEVNQGCYYSNAMLIAVNREIEIKEENIGQSSGYKSLNQCRKDAKTSVLATLVIRLAGVATGVLLGAFLGVTKLVVTSSNTEFSDAAQRGGVEGFLIGLNAAAGADNPIDAIQRTAEAVMNPNSRIGSAPGVGAIKDQPKHQQ
ncbi:GTPase IMAP family member 7-like isoform X2 [Betta splendens]|nr:GTPase IMAP family member 7-like isoform X2 [Betta splendens]